MLPDSAADAGEFPSRPTSGRFLIGAYLVVFLITLIPLLAASHPPLHDYPGHVARFYIESEIGNQPALQSIYNFSFKPIPNLAGELLSAPLTPLVGPYLAGRLLLAIGMLAWLAAPVMLYRALWGRFHLWPAFAALLVYNANLTWGFVNYYVTAPFAVLAFSAWVMRPVDRPRLTLPVFAVVSTLLFLGHLYALGLYALLVLAWEAGRRFGGERDEKTGRGGRMLSASVQFLPALVLLFTVSPHHGGLQTEFGGIYRLLERVLSCTLTNNPWTDIPTLILFVLVVAAGLMSGGRLKLHPGMRKPLIVLAIAALIAPMHFLGIVFIHFRLPAVVGMLLVASSRFDWPSVPERRALAGLFLVALLTRGIVIGADWHRFSAEIDELLPAFDRMQQGSSLIVANGHPREVQREAVHDIRHWHTASYSVIEAQVFLPNLFTVGALSATEPYKPLDTAHNLPFTMDELKWGADGYRSQPDRFDHVRYRPLPGWPGNFDYLLVYFPPPDGEIAPGVALEPVASGSFFTLYRIEDGGLKPVSP